MSKYGPVQTLALLGWCTFFGVCLWYAKHLLPDLGSTHFDDAFMYARYAKHWLAGDGFSWNLGEGPAFGCTSPLFLFFVTVLRAWTPASDALILAGLSTAFHFLAAAAMVYLTRAVTLLSHGRAVWAELLLPPLTGIWIILDPTLEKHAATGMETTLGLATLALFLAAAVSLRSYALRLRLGICLSLGLATIAARPDSGLYVLGFVPMLWWLENPVADKRAVLLYLKALLGLLLLYALLLQWLFGAPLPLATLAKSVNLDRGYLGRGYWPNYLYLLEFAQTSLPAVALLVLAFTRSAAKSLFLLLPLLLTFAYLHGVVQIMGFDARYYVPSLPVVAMVALYILATRLRSGMPLPWQALGFRAILLGGFVLLIDAPATRQWAQTSWQTRAHAATTPVAMHAVIAPVPSLPNLGWWDGVHAATVFAAKLPAGTTIAASEHGRLGAALPQVTIIDTTGLNDATVAWHGFQASTFFARRPDVIWLPPPDYSSTLAMIFDAPEFARDYEFYPGVLNYGIALRRDSATLAPARTVLTQLLKQVYKSDLPLEQRVATIIVP